MIIRALDGSHDWVLGKGLESYKKDNNAIAENIQTRLLSFLNDCWFDTQAGVDWIRLLGTNATKQEIILSCRGIILQSYGVVRVNKIDTQQNGRGIIVNYDIDTIFTTRFAQSLEVL